MRFIVFEGLDGAGKSTLMSKVQSQLEGLLQKYRVVRDPGSTVLGEEIRRLLLSPDFCPSERTELLLYEAARSQLVSEKVLPGLKAGEWVLSDRFYSSTVAFQCGARGLSREAVDWLNEYASHSLKPDLTIFIDITVAESRRRISKRTSQGGEAEDRMEQESLDFHEKVRTGYLDQAEQRPSEWLILDGTKTPEQLVADVMKEFEVRSWVVV